MLKINLLPIRQLKKRAKARNQILAALVIFCGVLVLLTFVGMLQAARISSLNEEIQAREKEKKSFDKVVQELAELERKRLELNEKIRIINQLKTDSYLTVHVLDEVAKLIDNNRMWLTSLSQSGGRLSLSGYALDNETIAQFMDELKFKSPYVNSVGLSNSSLGSVSGKDLKSFSLVCDVSSPVASTETAPDEGKQQ
jgi:type IV pilus assembly protein PilN